VTLSLVLLAAAGLFVQTLDNLRSANAGFRPEGLVVFGLSPIKAGYTRTQTPLVYDRVAEALQQTAGVTSVSFASDRLLADWNSTALVRFPDRTGDAAKKSVSWNAVGPGYFSTTGIHLTAGREIAQSDTEKSPLVAVVNESAAREYFDGSALGKRFYRSTRGSEVELEVVGVVADALHSTIRAGKRPMLYLPYRQTMANAPGVDFVVRTAGDALRFLGPVRQAVRRIDPNMPLIDLNTQTAQIDELISQERMFATLTSLFACLALLLSCLGLYGVISYGVARRVPEIGLRLTLGASGGRIVWLFFRRALLLVGCGVAVALPLLVFGTRLIRAQLFGVTSADPATLATVVAVMVLVAGTAALIPSVRAASIAPATALRHE
ncbi:MAG TPA: ABC transporter permease, partial [Bryobacteraceae bacterium]|nr:ABC transporter permease [Bryobacteraceae bacterium]